MQSAGCKGMPERREDAGKAAPRDGASAACGSRPFRLEKEYARHNRELKKVRRYLRQKGQKSEFEIYLLHHYDGFYEKALETAEKLQEGETVYRMGALSAAGGDRRRRRRSGGGPLLLPWRLPAP